MLHSLGDVWNVQQADGCVENTQQPLDIPDVQPAQTEDARMGNPRVQRLKTDARRKESVPKNDRARGDEHDGSLKQSMALKQSMNAPAPIPQKDTIEIDKCEDGSASKPAEKKKKGRTLLLPKKRKKRARMHAAVGVLAPPRNAGNEEPLKLEHDDVAALMTLTDPLGNDNAS